MLRRARSAIKASTFARSRNVGRMVMAPLRAQSGRKGDRDYASLMIMAGQVLQGHLTP